ncbi:cytoskeletal protein CcmA (bactofilin family) [Litorimonas taeanensis]|uniref:Cytoskeletal protein CcmA (Bactofilin family) n=1 Tax=Litorimonas taeanensis TaxID=568099 RepID=A0A420WK35_9PROT|nr:polymer-forming cytoskeletal protein [Litorimonas taeanensis]RKQ71265.1 cytoskeletal protein CcmA (bactofilin family) [Litorimonas taeanensis]
MFNKTNNAPVVDTARKNTPQIPRPTNSAPSILATNLVITGDINTDGDVQIDGRVDGNIKAGKVTVGEQGIINGKIIANEVHVRGKVTGKVDAASIELAETANVQADLIQDKLMIANGAFFDGKCARKTAPTSSASVKKPTPKPSS